MKKNSSCFLWRNDRPDFSICFLASFSARCITSLLFELIFKEERRKMGALLNICRMHFFLPALFWIKELFITQERDPHFVGRKFLFVKLRFLFLWLLNNSRLTRVWVSVWVCVRWRWWVFSLSPHPSKVHTIHTHNIPIFWHTIRHSEREFHSKWSEQSLLMLLHVSAVALASPFQVHEGKVKRGERERRAKTDVWALCCSKPTWRAI